MNNHPTGGFLYWEIPRFLASNCCVVECFGSVTFGRGLQKSVSLFAAAHTKGCEGRIFEGVATKLNHWCRSPPR